MAYLPLYPLGYIDCEEQAFLNGFSQMRDYIMACPEADVVERKAGKWILPNNKVALSLNQWICSECNYLISGKHNYCPNCGSYNGGDDDV